MSGETIFLIVASIIVAAGWSLFKAWKAERIATKKARLEDELRKLCIEISAYPGPSLTGEHIPQRFPSKKEALAFGETWSRCGKEGFKAKSVDSQSHDEDHPKFDSSAVSGGILYIYPALFFGMKEPYQDSEEWFMGLSEVKNKWLRDYLAHLKAGAST